jgi:hypothetical protein
MAVAFPGHIGVHYACGDPVSNGRAVLTETPLGRRREWQVQKLSGSFSVFADLLLAMYMVDARPASTGATRYREPSWQELLNQVRDVLANGRERQVPVADVVTSLWPSIQRRDSNALQNNDSQ